MKRALTFAILAVVLAGCHSAVKRSTLSGAVQSVLVLQNGPGVCAAVAITESIAATNAHCVDGVDSVPLRHQDGRESVASVIARSDKHDLALLESRERLQPIIMIDADEVVRPGDTVYVIGHPMRQFWTLTRGIISYIGRRIDELNFGRPLIQTDAAIHPGSSGGALVDETGRLIGIVVGIVSAPFSGHGLQLNFVIPVDQLFEAFPDKLPERGWQR